MSFMGGSLGVRISCLVGMGMVGWVGWRGVVDLRGMYLVVRSLMGIGILMRVLRIMLSISGGARLSLFAFGFLFY